ncbi:hypothetical protein I7I50_01239 [Histoplasma capsulatum G186AR]|uniref:Uncharacterized protein n=1 Tax=Ajellomyces capsulatus TaxID=5037 RepID=A0A8H8D256_AJECA|nr:hypothetical protein I7I52_08934 [Histoplasma capsulatum]QSS73172.1 hypothetical protein I7I50_01239 [Histoplasma capsulatum G186AR]
MPSSSSPSPSSRSSMPGPDAPPVEVRICLLSAPDPNPSNSPTSSSSWPGTTRPSISTTSHSSIRLCLLKVRNPSVLTTRPQFARQNDAARRFSHPSFVRPARSQTMAALSTSSSRLSLLTQSKRSLGMS